MYSYWNNSYFDYNYYHKKEEEKIKSKVWNGFRFDIAKFLNICIIWEFSEIEGGHTLCTSDERLFLSEDYFFIKDKANAKRIYQYSIKI